LRSLGLEEGFIITAINYEDIESPEQLAEVLSGYQGRIRLEGVNPNGQKGYYTFYLR